MASSAVCTALFSRLAGHIVPLHICYAARVFMAAMTVQALRTLGRKRRSRTSTCEYGKHIGQ